MKILITRDVKTPERGTEEAAGLDFFIPNDFIAVHLAPGQIMVQKVLMLALV